jgi:hypothetical protein
MLSDRAICAALDQFRLALPMGSVPPPAELQIMLDASLSMTSGDGSKEQRARELSILLLKLSEKAGLRGRVVALRGSDRNRVIEPADVNRLPQVPFDGIHAMSYSWQNELSDTPASTWRVVISDFLWPGNPRPLLETAARGVSKSWFVQLLDEWELHPSPAGASSLVDIETEQSVELILDETAISGYIARLESLSGSMADACRSVGASWVSASAATELSEFCREHLVRAGLLEEVPV